MLFYLEAILGVARQFGMILVLLLAHEHLQVVQLSRLQVALHLRQLVRELRLIRLDLDYSVQVELVIAVATGWTDNARRHGSKASFLRCLIRARLDAFR